MSKTKEMVIFEIKDYIVKCGGSSYDWYVGISSNPGERLFNNHNVDEKRDAWIFRDCENSNMAREVENYFIDIAGTDGGSGGGDYTARFVYAYKKSNNTVN